jgi:hypothetical protein
MAVVEDPFADVTIDLRSDHPRVLDAPRSPAIKKPGGAHRRTPVSTPVLGRLHGFDLLDQPLVTAVADCPGEVLTGRSTVALRRAMIGQAVVLLFEGGDVHAPIIIGVIEPRPLDAALPEKKGVTVEIDDERHVIEAEREIVLRCGDASITLTRAGKVIIKGNYILSRSTGYNKIKGAAIDIN